MVHQTTILSITLFVWYNIQSYYKHQSLIGKCNRVVEQTLQLDWSSINVCLTALSLCGFSLTSWFSELSLWSQLSPQIWLLFWGYSMECYDVRHLKLDTVRSLWVESYVSPPAMHPTIPLCIFVWLLQVIAIPPGYYPFMWLAFI